MTDVTFDLDEVPFSVRGSWLSVSRVVGLHRRAELVHLVSHVTGMHPVLAFQPTVGEAPVDARVDARSSALRWVCEAGEVTAAFAAPEVLRLRGRGLGMRITDPVDVLTPFTGSYLFVSPHDGAAVLTSYETGRRYRITPIRGAFTVLGAERLGAGERGVEVVGADWEIAIEQLASVGEPLAVTCTFDEVVAARAADFEAYARAVVPDAVGPAARRAGRLAAYVMWSATVAPAGFVTREAVLMSKHWMDKVWSWDHCFNALALAPGMPAEALDQFLLPFDHQSDAGAPPDSITHSEVLYNFVKPPIHGWAFASLRERLADPVPQPVLREVYERLSAWTRFWLDERRAPGHVLPYYEHGNDSGWDNSTVFDLDRLVVSPDLAAFLVVQLEVLAGLAGELGEDAGPWRAAHEATLGALLELWNGDRLVARSVGVDAGSRAASESSLLTALPVLASRHLPDDVIDALAAQVEAHLTEFGPATERVDSPRYEPDGYWRGPIWAPSTYLLVDGLRSAGRRELADEVSARFRRLCEQSGFAENFDALTGEGLRDRAYTWTASVYLLLLREAQS